jgi:hypothetical protein
LIDLKIKLHYYIEKVKKKIFFLSLDYN